MKSPLLSLAAPRLLAGFGTLALLTSVGLLSSRPAHTAGGPIAVSVANTPLRVADSEAARMPFAVSVYPIAGYTDDFTVPADKRLVIQQVSALTYSLTAKDVGINTIVSGSQQTLWVPFTDNAQFYLLAGQSVTDYADPGSTVRVFAEDADFNGDPFEVTT